MTDGLIEISTEGDLCIVTLNRADKANALTADILNCLADAAADARDAKAFVLTARGKVFSAGADLVDVRKGLATDPAWERLSSTIAQINGLTIAALNGTVAGGAFGMVLACDVRIAVPQAKFFYPVIKMGVAPQPSDPGRLASLIGPARAKMILLGGQKISAARAEMWGLVDQLSSTESLDEDARALTADILNADATNIQTIKNAL